MDPGPEPKKSRLSTASAASQWSTGPYHRGSQSNLNSAVVSSQTPPPPPPGAQPLPQPPHHHPTHPVPYQPARPFSRTSDPPPVSSPASPTPVSGLAYTHPHSLPPPPPPSQQQQHQQQQQPPPPPPPPPQQLPTHPSRPPPHFQDRRHYEPEPPYAPDQRHEYRPEQRPDLRVDYRQDQRPPPEYQDYRQDHYRQDYRHPPPSPAHHRSPPNTGPYPRDKHLSEDSLQRPDSASALHPPPTPSQQQIDDSRRQMSFDHLANPSPSPRTQPLQPPPPPSALHHHQQQPLPPSPSHYQHPSQPQPPPPPQHLQHPPQHQQHQPPPHPLVQPNAHPHVHISAPPSQAQPPPPPPPSAGIAPAPGAASNMYGPPTYPATSAPLPQTHHYEQPPVYGQATPVSQSAEVVYPVAYATAGKKKAQRASQACDSCRSLKAKCDETKPCKNCREKNIECKYRDPVPKQQDKVAADILEGINLLRSELGGMLQGVRHEFQDEFSVLGRRMSMLESRLHHVAASAKSGRNAPPDDPGSPSLEEPVFDADFPKDGSLTLDDVDMAKEEPADPANAGEEPPELALQPTEAEKISRQMQDDYNIDSSEPGPPVPPGEPAMPAYHSTLAGLLLTWSTINERVRHLLDAEGIKFLGEYPIRQEEQRGSIRFYGRGEGFDRRSGSSRDMGYHPREGDSLMDTEMTREADTLNDRMRTSRSSSHSSNLDDNISESSSTFPGEIWGQTGALAVPGSVDYKGSSSNTHPIGELDLTPEKVWKYVKSYEDNIQNMHPIMIPRELHAMVTLFLKSFPRASSSPTTRSWASAPVATFVGTPESPTVEGSLKRKRSPVPEGPGATSSTATGGSPQPMKPGQPFRSIDSALVLAVLALGKICLHKDRLPDVVPEDETEAANLQSPQAPNGYSPSSVQDSPSASSMQLGGERNPMSRRASLQSQSHSQTNSQNSQSQQYPKPLKGHHLKRNVDYIPGLDYFAVACDIIGNHLGAREFKLVWVLIIGSLYYGQLARPIQSLEFIAMAGRHLQTILRPHFYRYGKMRRDFAKLVSKRDNQYTFAFWTCLQLESDILAELQLPPSGLLAYEALMPYPDSKIGLKQGLEERVLQSYSGQLYLRNSLNGIHRNLYSGVQDGQAINIQQVIVLADSLQTDKWVPEDFRFDDNDPPAKDILDARLRAKYWGAQNVTHRYFVKFILEFNYDLRQKEREARWLKNDQVNDGPEIGIRMDKYADAVALSPMYLQFAQRGIKAMIESTRAFHGLPDKRMIVTNVFGTAHAQWGNLLVLDSIQRDPILGRFIDAEFLNDLFRKTISFFEVVAQPTNALGYDLRILKGLYNHRLQEPPAVPAIIEPGSALEKALDDAMRSFKMGEPSSNAIIGYTGSPLVAPTTLFMPMYGMVKAGETPSWPGPNLSSALSPPSNGPLASSTVMSVPDPLTGPANGPTMGQTTGPTTITQDSPVPMQVSPTQTTMLQTSPPTQTPPINSPPMHSLPSIQGSMAAPPMHSPSQIPLSQFGPPSVKGPSTPSESSFPHHLPPYDKRRSLGGSD